MKHALLLMFKTMGDLKHRVTKKLRRFVLPKYDFPSVKIVTGYGSANYFEQVRACYERFTNPFWYYKQIIGELLNISNLKIVPLYELMSSPVENRRLVGLRHDVDADPTTALRCARYLAQKGICGSFFLLFSQAI